MPSITPHMVVATEVAKILNINSEDFIRGNLLPDIIDIKNSHHKVESGIYMIPDIDYFIKKLDLTNDLDLGYLTHLLLDKHYLIPTLFSFLHVLTNFQLLIEKIISLIFIFNRFLSL